MSTPAIDLMHRHGSVREYRPDPVPPGWVEQIVGAAQRASTSSNLQAWSVVAVTDPARRERLAELCARQKHVAEAPVFLAWCADLARLDRACTLRGRAQVTGYVESLLVAVVDAALAMQNAALAAESLGLGICYVGAIRDQPEAVVDLLGLPRLVFPFAGMTLGWPAAEPRVRPRLAQPAVLHWERYRLEGQDQALAEYDRAMIATGIYEGRQVRVPGAPDRVEDYGWLEHSARRVSRPQRVGLRAALEGQGFGLD